MDIVESQEISPDQQFEKYMKSVSLAPISDQEQAFKDHRGNFVKNPALYLGLYGQKHVNPTRIYPYHQGNNTFHGVWVNHGKELIDYPFEGVKRQKDDQIATPETTGKVLDIIAHCFEESRKFYNWTGGHISGFYIIGMPVRNMESSSARGIAVSFAQHAFYIARALNNKDLEKLERNVTYCTSDFIHERTHHEYFDAEGEGKPEALSQGMQFLYAPGDNYAFEKYHAQASIDYVRKTLDGTSIDPVNNYTLGNLVWMAFLQKELHGMYPDQFQPLVSSANENLDKFSSLPANLKKLRFQLGESAWKTLQSELQNKLLGFSRIDESAIIKDFTAHAKEYGFDFIQ